MNSLTSGIILVSVFYVLILFHLAAFGAAPSKLIPRALLFGNPERSSPALSPDGRWIAYLAPLDGVMNVWARARSGGDDRPVTRDRSRGIHQFFWQYDNKHILYIRDREGDENWRLFAASLSGDEEKPLTPAGPVQARLVRHVKDRPNELLVALNERDPRVHDLYHLDLLSGTLTLREKNPGDITRWLADADLFVRGAVRSRSDGGADLVIRKSPESGWETLISWDLDDSVASEPAAFSKDGRFLYLLDSRGANTTQLVRLDLETKEYKRLAGDPQYDVSDLLLHPDTFEPQMCGWFKFRLEREVLDPSIREDIERHMRRASEGDFYVLSRDEGQNFWIVAFVKDNEPVRYYLYDRGRKKMVFLFSKQPKLKDYALAKTEPVSVRSRDGLLIHGYLTVPPDGAREALPTVVLVHGGPWSRDEWGWDAAVQWLANRGYACLQVNYRGSTGYGKAFVRAGNRQWGSKMQEDLVDAVQHLIEKGITDPDRVAVFGGSYGGYAALAGAAFTPDFFRCAVSIVGPSNLITFIESVPPYWKNYLASLYRRVGNPASEHEFLKSRSPLFKVDQIRIPVLIAQGANDPRVKASESGQMVEAMRAKGLSCEYLVFPDEGHGFARPENRLKFYEAAEQFLARHLGGTYEP